MVIHTGGIGAARVARLIRVPALPPAGRRARARRARGRPRRPGPPSPASGGWWFLRATYVPCAAFEHEGTPRGCVGRPRRAGGTPADSPRTKPRASLGPFTLPALPSCPAAFARRAPWPTGAALRPLPGRLFHQAASDSRYHFLSSAGGGKPAPSRSRYWVTVLRSRPTRLAKAPRLTRVPGPSGVRTSSGTPAAGRAFCQAMRSPSRWRLSGAAGGYPSSPGSGTGTPARTANSAMVTRALSPGRRQSARPGRTMQGCGKGRPPGAGAARYPWPSASGCA